jgi:hypothetical protein
MMNTEFDPVTHIGKVNGVVWPSVTQLLTEFGLQDFSGVPVERLEYKRILGTRVHAATVLLDNGTLDEEHLYNTAPECLPYLEAYKKFREIEGFEPLVKEYRLFSKRWKFHGAMDEVSIHGGAYNGHICIIDYKCTFLMYKSTGAQLSGYEILVKENYDELELPKELKRRKFLRFGLDLKPTGNYELVQFKDANDEQDFTACVWLHWAKRNKYKTRKGVEGHE